MGFFHDGESSELSDMMDKGGKHLFSCAKFILWAFKPAFKGLRAARDQMALQAAVQKMQQSAQPQGAPLQDPLSDLPSAIAQPDLSPPPRRKV